MSLEKSLVSEMAQIQLAIELIELGARLQVLEVEVGLSRSRLLKLYKEVRGESPPKGQLPFSEDWFMAWQPNIHASLFYSIYRSLIQVSGVERMEAFTKAYRLYLEEATAVGKNSIPVLGLTRAWTLVRFFECDMLQSILCTCCRGNFVAHAHTPVSDYVCGLCRPPPRAGKTQRRAAEVSSYGSARLRAAAG